MWEFIGEYFSGSAADVIARCLLIIVLTLVYFVVFYYAKKRNLNMLIWIVCISLAVMFLFAFFNVLNFSFYVLVLFLLLVYECLIMAYRAKDLSGRLICVGMGTLLAFQSFANIAVATAIFPNTGLPLPLVSYGVSSLLSIYLGMGVVLNVGLQRKFSNS